MPSDDDIRDSVARQLAPDAWRQYDKFGNDGDTHVDEVADSRRKADAIMATVRPLIRAEVLREAAGVAQAEESRLRAASFRATERPDIFPGLAHEREQQAVTAMEIMLEILALAEQETSR